jgi:ubiquitin C-terminal hydrolase
MNSFLVSSSLYMIARLSSPRPIHERSSELFHHKFLITKLISQSRVSASKANSPVIIQDMFRGELRSSIECSECGTESVSSESFLDLSISITGAKTLHDALVHFVQTDVLDDDDRYLCAKWVA